LLWKQLPYGRDWYFRLSRALYDKDYKGIVEMITLTKKKYFLAAELEMKTKPLTTIGWTLPPKVPTLK
jgi:hypothetical protein